MLAVLFASAVCCFRVWIKERGRWESVVFFVDFGNTETVPNESIFELPDEFWQVRPAAVPFKILGQWSFIVCLL